MTTINVADAQGNVHVLELPPGGDELTIDSSGARIETGLGVYWLRESDNGFRWDFQPAEWVVRTQRINELRRDLLVFLDAAGDDGRALAERVRRDHW